MRRKRWESIERGLRAALVSVAALCVLVEEGPLHGYALRQRLGELLGWTPAESTVYDVLKRLEKARLARSYWARSGGAVRKYYEATGEAREALQELKGLLRKATELLGGEGYCGA